MKTQSVALLAHPFRVFFLATGLYGVLVISTWVAFLFWSFSLPIDWPALQWHSHEMLYGLVSAAAAGFVLTAMTNWTGAAPLNNGRLLALVGLWFLGRVAMWTASWLPLGLVAVVDLAFLPVLGGYLAFTLLRFNNRRNLILVLVLALLTVGNAFMHYGALTGSYAALQRGQLLGFDVITLLMVIIAGRIVPAFSANWLRHNGGNPDLVVRSVWMDRLAIGSVLILVITDWIGAPSVFTSLLASAAGVINGVRLLQWAGWRVAREPLLWILHLAYAWIVVALLLRGWSAFNSDVPASLWQHILGVGGIGVLILGVMTRVAMGHTGRPLALPRFAIWIYIAILAATAARVFAAAGWVDFRFGVILAGAFWVLAFGLFVVLYAPVLCAPRPDGRDG